MFKMLFPLYKHFPLTYEIYLQALGSDVLLKFLPKYGLIIELDSQGKIIRSLHDPRASVISSVSEVEDVNGVLYLGSFQAPFIGKLDLNKL